MLLLVGLGNPGAGYSENRHNIGFMAVDEIVRRHSFSPWRKKFQAEVAEGTVGGVKVLAIKPQTYMNRSGQSVGDAVRFYKVDPENVVVIHDELDLPLGRLKVKKGGGHGGHNGLRDIDAHIGKEYRRIRLGIGHPGDKDQVTGHVLSDFAKGERPLLDKLMDKISHEFPSVAKGDDAIFMNRVAAALKPPKPKKQTKPEETEE